MGNWIMYGAAVMMLIGMRILLLLWWKPRKIERHFLKQGVRGPKYRFLVGNVKELVDMTLKASSQPIPTFSHNILPRVLSFYHHWSKIYGASFIVWFGPTVRFAVSEPDMVREVLSSNSQFYEKVEAHPLLRQLEGDGLLSLKGGKWAHHRRIIAPTSHVENLRLLVPVVTKSVSEMVDTWPGDVEIDVFEWFQSSTEDIIARIVFGNRCYEEGKAIFRLQSQQMALAGDAFRKLHIPGYRFVPTKMNLTLRRLDKEIRRSLIELVSSRRSALENGEFKEDENLAKDLLGLMIKASLSNSTVTVNDIVEECKTFFFAGKQTTSNLLTWAMVLLCMHPAWQDQAREELFSVCGSRDSPTKDDVVRMKTLSMIVNETLRLYPPVIATIRRSKADVELGGYRIPKGIELLMPILALHHDQALWGADVAEFNPGRFEGGVARAAKHPLGFMPFGLGSRSCIGQNLAVLQTKLTLAIILQRFSFRLAPHYRHAPTVLFLLYPQHGAPVIFKRLN